MYTLLCVKGTLLHYFIEKSIRGVLLPLKSLNGSAGLDRIPIQSHKRQHHRSESIDYISYMTKIMFLLHPINF